MLHAINRVHEDGVCKVSAAMLDDDRDPVSVKFVMSRDLLALRVNCAWSFDYTHYVIASNDLDAAATISGGSKPSVVRQGDGELEPFGAVRQGLRVD